MGRIMTSVSVENLANPDQRIRCDALVDTGASHVELPSAWRDCLGDLEDGVSRPSPLDQVQHQILLGDSTFLAKIHDAKPSDELREVSKAHRRSVAKPLAHYRATNTDRDTAMAEAYASGAYTMKEIGEFFGVHYMTVSRAVKKHRAD